MKLHFGILPVAFFVLFSVCIQVNAWDDQVRQILGEVQTAYEGLLEYMREVARIPSDNINLEQKMQGMRLLKAGKRTVFDIADKLKDIPIEEIIDQDLVRQVKLALDKDMFVLNEIELNDLLLVEQKIAAIPISPGLCDFDNPDKCDLAYSPDVEKIIRNSINSEEILYYWYEYRNSTAEIYKPLITKFVNLYRTVALRNGYETPSHYYYLKYDTNQLEEFITIIDSLKGIYAEFHAYIRQALRHDYGESVLPESRAIPHHLFEQVVAQVWKKNSVVRPPYPHNALPNIKTKLEEDDYSTLRMHQVAEEFFGPPLLPLAQNFWEQDYMENNAPDCKPSVIDYFNGSALTACSGITFKRFLEAHSSMASVHVQNEINTLPIILQQDTAPGWVQGIQNAVAMSASTPTYLNKIGLAPNYEYEDQKGLNRQFRNGLKLFLNLFEGFVTEMLFVELIDDVISIDDLNCRYWELMSEYLGVEPPFKTWSNQLDLPVSFYNAFETHKPNSANLFAEIISYSIYEEICIASEVHDPSDPYKPLDDCDFSKNEMGLDSLKQFMSVGRQMPYKDAIEKITDYRVPFEPLAIEQYFTRIVEYLETLNKSNDPAPGWLVQNMCY